MSDKSIQINEPCGVLIINKHSGVTSHDIVNKIRRLYGTARVGHTGTLDPMASGVLVVLIGRAAKAAEYLVSNEKKYRAFMRLGMTTDTEDISGAVLSTADIIPSYDEVKAVADSFVGECMQIPPMYSALKVGGKKLCDLARQGVTVERQSRKINIFSLDVKEAENGQYSLDVHCSSGTYIRTLCADIGAKLGCGAVMSGLERTEAGGFSIEESVTVAELEEMTFEERKKLLIPTEMLFEILPKIKLSEFYERLCRNGCEIYQKKAGCDFPEGEKVSLYGKDGFFGIGEVKEYPDGLAVKAIKFFVL